MQPTNDDARRLLLVAADPQVLASVRRVAAAAGVEVVDVPTAGVAAAWRRGIPMVLDVDAATALPPLGRRLRLMMATARPADPASWQAAVAFGAEAVVELPRQERALLDWLATGAEPAPAGRLVGCVAGRGGAGASTLAAALALAAARRSRTLLLDADPGGGGQELLVGAERIAGARWHDVASAAGSIDGAALAAALPCVNGLSLLSFASRVAGVPVPGAVEAVVAASLRAFDVVVADLARPPTATSQPLLPRCDAVLVVVGADVRGVSAAAAVVAAAKAVTGDVRLVVRTPAPGDLRPADVATALDAHVAATWGWDRRLGACIDAGAFGAQWRRGRLGRVAERLVVDLALRPVS